MRSFSLYAVYEDMQDAGDCLVDAADKLVDDDCFYWSRTPAERVALVDGSLKLFKVTIRIEEEPLSVNPADEYSPDVEELRNA